MKRCTPCSRGFHDECLHKKGCRKCHPTPIITPVAKETIKRKSKVDGLKDEKSTGRKRAAILYPLDANAECEWRLLKNCGGGRRPIIGCIDGTQEERHHGPVKRTIRNEEGNVHRICTPCHIHWHELNDLIYDEAEYNNLPHMPVAATPEESVNNTLDWQTGKMKLRYELASSQNQKKFRERMKDEV